ncbi:cysteine-rich RLK (RECEPTOR-like protein kinase) 8 [Abeliophyllum distichum]|uniref:Cysteine-rich RLK (RECEPTOR-like protein kinase) 8 n=1 Tax=Abeliophyllum distichum TaxID=126358 RepID=A0ABD1V6W4_9LAMI
MNDEIRALEANNTWFLLPPSYHPIGCKWVFKVKFHSDDTVERYKAQLVEKEFTQQEWIDYNETFTPVAKYNNSQMLTCYRFYSQLDASSNGCPKCLFSWCF